MLLNDLSSPLSYLASRRSGRPRDMIAPGPDADQRRQILEIASRTPDHGKLTPWRFIHVGAEQRPAFHDLLTRAFTADNPEPGEGDREAIQRLAYQAPCLFVVTFAPVTPHKIPEWEQFLSSGAAAMNLLHGAHALGFAGGWITGWASRSEIVRTAFCSGDERIVGLVYIGTPGLALEERPRPALADISREWLSET